MFPLTAIMFAIPASVILGIREANTRRKVRAMLSEASVKAPK